MATYSSRHYDHNSHNAFNAYPESRPLASSLLSHVDPVVQKHLRKVYSSLLTAVLAAAAGSALTLQQYAKRQYWPATLASYLTLPILLAFYFLAPHSKWRAPLFYTFAFVDGAAAAPLISLVTAVDPRIPTIAFLAAAAVFACCSISAILARRKSYLFIGSFCLTALFGLAFVSLISSIWSSYWSFSIVIYGGLLVFCGFVLYDTQMIIEKAHAGERDHLQHALDLLINFIAIFKRVAIIMANNNVQRERRNNDRKRNESSQ